MVELIRENPESGSDSALGTKKEHWHQEPPCGMGATFVGFFTSLIDQRNCSVQARHEYSSHGSMM